MWETKARRKEILFLSQSYEEKTLGKVLIPSISRIRLTSALWDIQIQEAKYIL